jgi:NADH pyrophosphatase NudC (nudix superfamily)
MLGFLAQADADTPVAGDELEDARWFDAASVRAGLARDWNAVPDAGSDDADGIVLSSPFSIARWLAVRWLATQPG